MHNAGVLNKYYKELLTKRTIKFKRSINDNLWGSTSPCLCKGKDGPELAFFDDGGTEGLSCCGITEVDFTSIDPIEALKLEDFEFDELVAKYLKNELKYYKDNRIFITGLPIRKTVRRATRYNFKFYTRLLKTLESLGWRRITTNYVNNNSKNELAVLAVQKEEPDASLQTV